MKCLVFNCEREGDNCRGLCRPCYKAAYYLVRKGTVSWAALEKLGKVLPVGGIYKRRKRFSYFADGCPEPHLDAKGIFK